MKKEDKADQESLEDLMELLKKNARSNNNVQGGKLKSNTPNYVKLLSTFLRILKSAGIPVILKKEENNDTFTCHDFEETNIKSICYAYALNSFRDMYPFVKPLEELYELKTKVFFDEHIIKVHLEQNEWWLCKKKKGQIHSGKTIAIPIFNEFYKNKENKFLKNIPVKTFSGKQNPPQSNKNCHKEIINISEKCFKILEKNWKGRERIASLSLDFAVDKKGNLMIYDFDVCIISVNKGRKEEINLSRQVAHTTDQLSINNILILKVGNFSKPLTKPRKNKKK